MTMGNAVVLAAATVGGWLVFYAIVVVTTRPARVRPGPATQQLGSEPPAVVNLLANRWRLTVDAAEATLLDLAARGFLGLQQAGADPVNTVIHVRGRDERELLPYERHVLDRVRQLAVNRVVPVTALAFRDQARARSWNLQLRRMVVGDARRRGLSRRRISPPVAAALIASAAAATIGPAAVGWTVDTFEGAYVFAAIAFLVMFGLAFWSMGERDTPAGVAAAQRWLGVREWLRAHEEFANLPPAAVTVWDRYLAHGAALGVTRTTSAVLDLGMGDRRRVWSAYGDGQWRRVRVRYPRLRIHSGLATGWLVVLALAGLLPGTLAMCLGLGALVSQDPVGAVASLTVCLVATGYGGYVLYRTVHERRHPQTIAGEVLWVRPWRRPRFDRHRSDPWLHFLAVYDGHGDTTTAWGLPKRWVDEVVAGDIVEITAWPWSRRVTDLRVVEPGPRRPGIQYAGPGAGQNPVVHAHGGFVLENPRTPEPGPWH